MECKGGVAVILREIRFSSLELGFQMDFFGYIYIYIQGVSRL